MPVPKRDKSSDSFLERQKKRIAKETKNQIETDRNETETKPASSNISFGNAQKREEKIDWLIIIQINSN